MTNTEVVPADFPYRPVWTGQAHDGVQAMFRFGNGYGASVIKHSGSYGVELATIRYTGESVHAWDFASGLLTEADPSGIIGWLNNPAELADALRRIEELPAPIVNHSRKEIAK